MGAAEIGPESAAYVVDEAGVVNHFIEKGGVYDLKGDYETAFRFYIHAFHLSIKQEVSNPSEEALNMAVGALENLLGRHRRNRDSENIAVVGSLKGRLLELHDQYFGNKEQKTGDTTH